MFANAAWSRLMYPIIFAKSLSAARTCASFHFTLPFQRALYFWGPVCARMTLSRRWVAAQISLSPSASAGIPFALKTSATRKNSAIVFGGWRLYCANSLGLYHMTFERWIFTGML